MDALTALAHRHSKRAYLDKRVDRATLEHILRIAAQAPSSKNTQSWSVEVLTDTAKDELSSAICAKFDAGEFEKPDYTYMPNPMDEVHMTRARACGYSLFELMGIDRKDRAARTAHDRRNFTFFGAPVVMIFHLPANAQPGMFLDMGAFMQNIQIALTAEGMGSCPQFSVATYAPTVRKVLGLDDGRLIVAALSLGYPDTEAQINTFIPTREELDAYTTWRGF